MSHRGGAVAAACSPLSAVRPPRLGWKMGWSTLVAGATPSLSYSGLSEALPSSTSLRPISISYPKTTYRLWGCKTDPPCVLGSCCLPFVFVEQAAKHRPGDDPAA